ncbi:hypothetical protein CISIN_1g0086232mg, partial [Citrus sinensis]
WYTYKRPVGSLR